MSGNNSIEIVTQKELEGVLGNKAFNADQFLKVYEEWKQTHDTGLFAQLRSMHQNAGYKNKNMIFGSESEMHEIAAIVKKFKDGKVEISTTVTAGTAAVAATNSSPQVASGSSVDSSDIETEYKYSLEKYASFATRELGKSGKNIKNLQETLKEKKCYSGEITGKFDNATLEAVRAFQTSVPNIKYGVDGLVGPVTIGELFGIATPSNVRSSRRGDNESDEPRASTEAPVAPVRSSQTPADIQPEVNNSVANIRKELTTTYTDFITYTSKIDKWFGAVRDSKDNVDTQRSQLNNKIEALRTLFSKYENNPNASVQNMVSAYKLNLSYYLVDDLSGVSNNLYKNIGLSQNIAIEVLNQDKKRIEPIPEGKIALFNTLDSLKGTPLGNTIAEAMRQNPDKNIYDIISNPTIKGGWESAYSKIFDKSLQSLDSSIDSLGNDPSLNPQQKKALTHLKDIRGKNGWYNLKTENITAMWQFAKVGGAVVAGAAATYISAGTLGPMAAAGVGALVATGGTGLARGYWDGRETLIDGGINLLSFGGGALVVKLGQAIRGTQIVEGMGKIGSIGTGIAIDGVGNISIGVAGDSIRAHLHGEDLNTWDSLKMNAIPWAIFALALNARGVKVPPKVLADAHSVENSVARAEATAHLGGSPKADLDNIKAKGPELENFGKTQQNNTAHITPPEHSGTKLDTNLHGDPIAPNPGTVNSKTKPTATTEGNETVSTKAKPSKNTETAAHAQKTVTAHAENPQAAHAAVENVAHSSKKMGETFSTEWLEKISHALGKPVKWVADQSVGPIFRMITGNNPSALLSLVNPMGGWTTKASTYGKNLVEHWKSPVRNVINVFVTGERKDGQGAFSSIAKNVFFAGGITALDYFAVPNDQANTSANMFQNYYELILLGWLGVVLMENGPIIAGIKDGKDYLLDRMQAKPL